MRLSQTTLHRLRRIDLLLVTAAFLALLPLLGMQRTTDFIIFCVYVVAFDVLYGHMGRLSFGHMLYLGTGAYGASLCAAHLSENPFVALAVAISAGAAVGLLLGPIVVRTTGACFALINLAFNMVGHFLVLIAFAHWTGGEDGASASFSKVGPLDVGDRQHMFVLALASLVGVVWLVRRLTGSPFGILLRTVKEKEERVGFLGYDTRRHKLLAFVVSTSLAAFAGGLSTLNYTYVTPSFMDPTRNVEVIFASLIGGAGSVYGALVGGVTYMTISNFLPKYIERWEMFLGIALVILVFRFRAGLWGWLVARVAPRRDSGLGVQP
jgi:branched-chain amino acid transport system permease protein